MKNFILLFLFLLSAAAWSATCTASQSGNWDDGATWSCGRAPACGDSLVIPGGITVTVAEQADYNGCASAIKLNIAGTLSFINGKKLLLPCGSDIVIQSGGQILSGGGGGSSNQIEICGTAVWSSSQGPASGPMYLSQFSVMPIELKAFYALPEGETINIYWESATETNNKEYTLEQSRDGLRFEAIATLASKAPNGNSLASLSYQFTDRKPISGTSYYRLKQTDFNGKYEYFQVISVDHEGSKHITFTVYPNPNQGQFTVDFTGVENNHEIEVNMYDQNGRLAYQQAIFSESLATNTFSIIPETRIASGVYMVNFIVEGIKYPVKVIVQ
jgi:hypothetical protein